VKKYHWKRYKEKICPTCNKKHRGRYTYCSQSCVLNNKPKSEEHKAKTSASLLNYFQKTPEGIAARQKVIKKNTGVSIVKLDDIDVIPPGMIDPDFDF
jgi:hypothetical protein